MDRSASVHLRNALNAVHSPQLMQNNEKPPLPVDLNTALSLLTRPTVTLPASFPHFSPFSFPDPSTLFAFSQLRSNLPNYQTTTIISPLLSATIPTTSAISGPSLGPSPIKRPNREQQSVSSPPSCSSSSVTSSSSPQQSPHRKQAAPVPDDKKDEAYYERRRKNNDAAKRSRDARRQKEEAVAARAAFLEQENIQLRSQVVLLKNETAKLQLMLFSKPKLLDPKMLSAGHSNSSEQQKPESADI
ncbi:basic region leucine zipper [Onchocerca flexuosa]|uniref:Basic region leucine zipper n=1 Tax=Onchocerca flexuosa TaxID=387005 RepID=A0A238C6Z8_9BILA|nr:basic region leucine zipper [Onchocerca flexuosa]